jgi:type I restriction enzyme R subunit
VKDTGETKYPESINSKSLRSLYDNLDNNESLALSINKNILKSRQDNWKSNAIKQKQIKNAIKKAFAEAGIKDESEIERIFNLAVNQDEY